MAEQDIQEIYSLLVPVAEGRMLLPRASVAEVVGYLQPEAGDDLPDWVLGHVLWNERRIPLVSFEGAGGQEIPEHTGRDRIIVVFSVTEKVPGGYFAILTQGHPHLVRVNEGVLRSLDDEEVGREPDTVLVRARMANERPVIPDLETLERKLARALGVEDEDEAAQDVSGDEPTMVAGASAEIDELADLGGDDAGEGAGDEPADGPSEDPWGESASQGLDPDELTEDESGEPVLEMPELEESNVSVSAEDSDEAPGEAVSTDDDELAVDFSEFEVEEDDGDERKD